MSNNKQTLLRILSGSHSGAEAPLDSDYVYTVGSGAECDIILEDQEIADLHVRLRLEGGKVVVTPEADQVWLDGIKADSEDGYLEMTQVLTLGKTALAIGPDDTDWSAITFPAGLENTAVEEGAAQQTPTDGAEQAAVIVEVTEPHAGTRQIKKRGMLPALLMLIVPLFLGLVLFGWFYLESPEPSVAEVKPVPPIDIESIRKRIGGAGFEAVTAELADPGRLILSGYVESNNDRLAVKKSLDDVDLKVVNRLMSQEQIVENSRYIINEFKLPVRVESLGFGEIALEGELASDGDLQKVVQLLENDVTGLLRVQNSVKITMGVEKLETVAGDTEKELPEMRETTGYGVITSLRTGRTFKYGTPPPQNNTANEE